MQKELFNKHQVLYTINKVCNRFNIQDASQIPLRHTTQRNNLPNTTSKRLPNKRLFLNSLDTTQTTSAGTLQRLQAWQDPEEKIYTLIIEQLTTHTDQSFDLLPNKTTTSKDTVSISICVPSTTFNQALKS